MKNYYDKALLILTLVLLGFGVVGFFTSGGLPKSGPPPHLQDSPKGGAYENLVAPKVPEDKISWPDAEDQTPKTEGVAKGRVYDVFTPPKIWYDTVNKVWAWLPPVIMANRPPFGIHLVAMKDKPYRIQLKGFAGDEADANKFLVEFEDTTTGDNFYARKGEDVSQYNVKLVDFSSEIVTPEPDKDEDGGPSLKDMVGQAGGNATLVDAASENSLRERVYKAVIHDDLLNKDVELISNKPTAEEGAHFMFLQTEPPLPAKDWNVEKVGDALDLPENVHFEVKEVNFDVAKPSVSVEKSYIYTDPRTNNSIPTTEDPPPLTPQAPSDSSNSTPSSPSPSPVDSSKPAATSAATPADQATSTPPSTAAP